MTSSDLPTGSRRLRIWGLALLVVLGCVVVRVVVSGGAAVDRGEASLEAGDELAATVSLREAVSWYLPLAPWRARAADALWMLHERQVDEGRVADAVRTLQSLRSGFFAARSLVHPDDERLAAVDAALPGLMATWEAEAAVAEGRPAPGSRVEREAFFAARLADDARPGRGWSVLAVLGFGLWVGAALQATRRVGRARWRMLGAAAVGFAGFMIGVAFA